MTPLPPHVRATYDAYAEKQMSKTPGQIAFEAALGDAIKTPYEILAPFSKWNWEAAANAIIEECAKVAEELHWVLPFYADPQANELTDNTAEEIRSQVALALRALKSAGKEDGNG